MKKLAKRFAIGAMAAMMALSAFSAQAAVSGELGVSPAGLVMSQDNSDSILYHSMGFIDENYGNYVTVGGSPVIVNALSGNVYFELSDLPTWISYNSLRDNNVGYGPNFTSNPHSSMEKRADGSYVYNDLTGAVTHPTYNAERGEIVDERGWSMEDFGYSSYIRGYMNSKPTVTFDGEGRYDSQASRDMNGQYHTYSSALRDENGLLLEFNSYVGTAVYEYYPAAEGEVPMIKSITVGDKKYVMFYNDQGNLLRVENAAGEIYLDFDYDASGKLITRVGSTHIQYDDQGRAVNVKTYKTTGGLQDNISFSYGNFSTVVTKTNGTTEIMNFNPDGSRNY